jgi:ABC-type multidrug transport system ATPase subunit
MKKSEALDFSFTQIGLLRGGKLLAEAPPERLMSIFNSSNLEEVFLTLSQKQDEAGGTVVHSSYVRACVI